MNPLELVTAYQQSAVVAAACGTDPRATRALLGGLVALGLADHGPGGYALSADGAALGSDHPGSVALIVAMEWFFCQAWARFGGELPALAGLEGPDRLLDVGGGAWPAPRLTAWLDAAGLAAPELRRGAGPIAVVRAHAPKP